MVRKDCKYYKIKYLESSGAVDNIADSYDSIPVYTCINPERLKTISSLNCADCANYQSADGEA